MNKVATSIEPAESELFTAPSIESINELAQCFEQLSNRGSACIVANNPFKVKEVFDFITSHGINVLPLGSSIFEKFCSQFTDIDCGLIIVCTDDFNSLGGVVQKLREFREQLPHVSVILMSGEFTSDDSSLERLPICDVSIQIPIKKDRLEEYFAMAWANNNAWTQRLAELEYDKILVELEYDGLMESIEDYRVI